MNTTIDQEAVQAHLGAAHAAVTAALADIPILLAEVRRLALLTALARLSAANLEAAARAALAAERDGEDDPLAYLRMELER